ncbi:MAG TPA: hypothetical protein VH721_10050, partial [Gaiellaceae bacterium]
PFLELEERLAFLLDEHPAQQPPEEPYVAAQRAVRLVALSVRPLELAGCLVSAHAHYSAGRGRVLGA